MPGTSRPAMASTVMASWLNTWGDQYDANPASAAERTSATTSSIVPPLTAPPKIPMRMAPDGTPLPAAPAPDEPQPRGQARRHGWRRLAGTHRRGKPQQRSQARRHGGRRPRRRPGQGGDGSASDEPHASGGPGRAGASRQHVQGVRPPGLYTDSTVATASSPTWAIVLP